MYLPGRALLEELRMASSVQRALMSSMGITECSGRKRTNATHQTCSLNCFFFKEHSTRVTLLFLGF